MVYWLPVVTPDPIAPLYASVTAWPAASWNPPLVEKLPGKPGKVLEKLPEKVRDKFPENVLEKLPDPEKVREKDVELKERVKLDCAVDTGLRVLLLCTRNAVAPAKHAGNVNPVRLWFVCEVVVVVVVEEHPLPGVTSNELMDTACDRMFSMVTNRELPERAALLISILPWLVEELSCVVATQQRVVRARDG
jgi:hypothetical protein